MGKKTIADIDVSGKRALVRVDFNVPRDKATGEITDDVRMRAALPTIEYLIDHDAKVILMTTQSLLSKSPTVSCQPSI